MPTVVPLDTANVDPLSEFKGYCSVVGGPLEGIYTTVAELRSKCAAIGARLDPSVTQSIACSSMWDRPTHRASKHNVPFINAMHILEDRAITFFTDVMTQSNRTIPTPDEYKALADHHNNMTFGKSLSWSDDKGCSWSGKVSLFATRKIKPGESIFATRGYDYYVIRGVS